MDLKEYKNEFNHIISQEQAFDYIPLPCYDLTFFFF